jgi:hypothetical protein
MRPNPSSPKTPSLAAKIVTLLFSGGVASTAILHGASSGCGDPPAPEQPAPPPAPAPAPEPAAAPATVPEPAPAPAPDAKSPTDDPLPEPRYFGGAKFDPDAWRMSEVVNPPPAEENKPKPKPKKRGEK